MTLRREEIVALSFEELQQKLQIGTLSAVDTLQAFQAKALGMCAKDSKTVKMSPALIGDAFSVYFWRTGVP